MKPRRMHWIDKLARRVQLATAADRELDLEVARALYGERVYFCPRRKRYRVLRLTATKLQRREISQYTRNDLSRRHAVGLLRKRKAELTAPTALRMAA